MSPVTHVHVWSSVLVLGFERKMEFDVFLGRDSDGQSFRILGNYGEARASQIGLGLCTILECDVHEVIHDTKTVHLKKWLTSTITEIK